MIPSNLSERMMVLSPAATRDEDSIYAHRVFGVRFFDFMDVKERNLTNGKKTVYL